MKLLIKNVYIPGKDGKADDKNDDALHRCKMSKNDEKTDPFF